MRGRGSFAAAVFAAPLLAGTATGASQSSVVGSGSGHFAETGGPFSLSVNGRGEGPLAQGHVRGSGSYVDYFEVEGPITCRVCTDPTLNPAWTPLESGDFDVHDAG